MQKKWSFNEKPVVIGVKYILVYVTRIIFVTKQY